MQPVQLLFADSGSAPTGTGSYSYFANFRVLVKNLAYAKDVRIVAHHSYSGWASHPCSYASSGPANSEIWTAHLGDAPIDQFAVEYQVQGQTFWDNNNGTNYLLDVPASATDGIGSVALNPMIQTIEWSIDPSGKLSVDVLVKNIAFTKSVGIVYTTDNWATSHVANGFYQTGYAPYGAPTQPNAEYWLVAPSVGAGAHGQFAVFYTVEGTTYWDNNLNANYSF